jgi:hypothetical protein
VAHPQTHSGRLRNALNTSSFLFRNEAAPFAAKGTDSSSFFPTSGRQQRNVLDTYSSFPFQNKAAAFAAKGEEEEEVKSRTEAASTGSGTGRKRARSSSIIEKGSKGSKGSSKDSTADPLLDSWTNMGVALYGRTEEPTVAGDNKLSEEDPAAVANCAAAKPMPQQTRDT